MELRTGVEKNQARIRHAGVDRMIDRLIEILLKLKKLDRTQILKELRELSYLVTRQVFNQIPSASALAACIVGVWVTSTFTASPWKALLSKWGLMKGGRHLVSSQMYQFLSVVLPILVAAVTAYLVQKMLKRAREQQMGKNIVRVSQLGKDVQTLVQEKLQILEKAKEAGLLSSSEYFAKKANVYATYSRTLPAQFNEFLISKLTT
jgi:hypothetical protein